MPRKTVGSRVASCQTGVNLGPFAFGGDVYFVDPVDGADGNDGKSPESAVKTIEVGYAKLRDGENDTLVVIGTATAMNITSTTGLPWAKSYAHLVGGTADLPGEGQRARIIASTSVDSTYTMQITGSGCVFKNIQFYNANDTAEDSWAVYLTGDRCYFENCVFNGMMHATAAARAGSGSLKIVSSNGEHLFNKCTIGSIHMARTAANSELYLNSPSTKFHDCYFLSSTSGSGTGHFFINIAGPASGEPHFSVLKDCIFVNPYEVTMTDAITKTGAGTHWVMMKGCMGEGFTGWTDTATALFSADPAPNNGFGLGINPAA